jgi:hypothetical protein
VGTSRLDAIGRGNGHGEGLGFGVGTPDTTDTGQHDIPWGAPRDEDDQAVDAAHAPSAVGQAIDRNLDFVAPLQHADLQSHPQAPS